MNFRKYRFNRKITEGQIEQVIYNIGGMFGDLEGIAGMTLPNIKTLELPTLETETKE